MDQQPKAFDDRSSYIGGPGAATILGVNPYQTPLDLWRRLTGRDGDIVVNEEMRSGQRLEAAVLAYAAEELHAPVLPGPFVRDPTQPLGGHLDGILERGDIVEAKTARSKRDWGEPGTAEVPASYAAQALHYMGLTGAGVCWIPVLFSGLDFALYRVDRDEVLIARMRELCLEWWERHVAADVPPPPVTGADAALLFPKDSGKVVVADDVTKESVGRLRDVRLEMSMLEQEKENLEARIKLFMGDASSLTVDGEFAVTWKTTKPSQRFDSAALKAARPEVYEAYCRTVESRRFLLKS
jgi:putative phage-type endonuclease